MARTSKGSHGWGRWARQRFNLLDLPQDPTFALCSSPLPPWFPPDHQQRGGQSAWSQRSFTTSQVSWRDKVPGLEPPESPTHWRHQWRWRDDFRPRGRWLCAWGQASSTCWTSRWSWRWWWLRAINCWWWSPWWWSTSWWWSSPVPWIYGTAWRITFVPWTFGTTWWTFSVPWTYGTTRCSNSSNGWWTSSTSNVAHQQHWWSGALSRSFSGNTSSWSSFRPCNCWEISSTTTRDFWATTSTSWPPRNFVFWSPQVTISKLSWSYSIWSSCTWRWWCCCQHGFQCGGHGTRFTAWWLVLQAWDWLLWASWRCPSTWFLGAESWMPPSTSLHATNGALSLTLLAAQTSQFHLTSLTTSGSPFTLTVTAVPRPSLMISEILSSMTNTCDSINCHQHGRVSQFFKSMLKPEKSSTCFPAIATTATTFRMQRRSPKASRTNINDNNVEMSPRWPRTKAKWWKSTWTKLKEKCSTKRRWKNFAVFLNVAFGS